MKDKIDEKKNGKGLAGSLGKERIQKQVVSKIDFLYTVGGIRKGEKFMEGVKGHGAT